MSSSDTVMVPREAIEALAREYRPSMDKDTVHDWGADAAAMLKRLAASPRPQAAGPDAAKLIAYEDAHAVAVELGYPSLTEALEALAASPQQSPAGEGGDPDEQDVLDTIADAIGDSMDLDWTYSIGAKAIVEAFKREGWAISAPPVPSVSGVE